MPSTPIYQSEFTGAQMDARFALVDTMHAALTELEQAVRNKYEKPYAGIPASDMDADVQTALERAMSAVQSLADYYTKAQVDAIVSALNSTAAETVTVLPTASEDTLNKVYYVGPDGGGEYDRYVTSYDGSVYSWIPLGTTALDLTSYATKAEVQAVDEKVGETEVIPGEESIDLGTLSSGSIRASTGAAASSSTAVRTGYLDISALAGKTLIYSRQKVSGSDPSSGLAFFNASQEYISGQAWIGDSDDEVLERTEISVPANAKYVRFCLRATEEENAYMKYPTEKVVYTSGLGKDVQDLKDEVAGMESGQTKDVTENLPAVVGVVYDGTVGNAPSAIQASNYNSIAVTGLEEGNIITVHSYPGSSYYNWLRVKDGVVVAVGSKGARYNTTITCDGSFDTLLLNSYNPRLSPTVAAVTKPMDAFDYTDFKIAHINDGTDVKPFTVLCFGNSFTQGSMGYVPAIIHQLAPDFKFRIAMAIIGGSPLAQHYAYFTGKETTLGDYTYRIDPETGNYQRVTAGGSITFNSGYFVLVSRDGAAWEQTASAAKIENLITEDSDWDIITFQQNGNNADDSYDTYFAPFIYELQDNVISRLSHPSKLGWILTHGAYKSTAAQRLAAWEGTAENARKVMERSAATVLFPYGTAVQNLRTVPALEALGDYGGGMQQDEGHLQQGIGDLASAYAMAITILKEADLYDKIYGDTFLPTSSAISRLGINWNVGTGPIGVSEANARLAQIAATKAVDNPYALTDINVFVPPTE